MNVYIYKAGLYCGDCIGHEPVIFRFLPPLWTRREIVVAIKRARITHNIPDGATDTDRVPEWSGAGGGEADTPSHCETCGKFLRNFLTSDGTDYLHATLWEYVLRGTGNVPVLREWIAFYLEPRANADEFHPNREQFDGITENADAFGRYLEVVGACESGREFASGMGFREAYSKAESVMLHTGNDYDSDSAEAAEGFRGWIADRLTFGNITCGAATFEELRDEIK